MTEQDIAKLFPIHLPIADKGVIWNGQPDEFSNIGFALNYSQKFGLTPYAKTGVYGAYNGQPRPHNGHDFAGFEDTPLVTPCRVWISYAGFDAGGYGNCCFMETEAKTVNGDTVKMEYVIAHMKRPASIAVNRWHDAGKYIGPMGSTGMSTGDHTHFGGRPWLRQPDGSWKYLMQDDFHLAARGYIDLEPSIIEHLVYDKQALINIKNIIMANEKKFIMEGEGHGRVGILINGKLREVTKERLAEACMYVLTNNGFGKTVSSKDFDSMSKDKAF